MKPEQTIFITGTHHTPAIELIQLLKTDPATNWHIHYVSHQHSTDTHILHTIIPKLQIPYHNLDCGKFNRKDILQTILGIPKTISAFFQSLRLLQQFTPQLVVSFGGYVSVPVIIAAFAKHIPTITHEQTLTNSLATRINSLFANKVALSFDIPDQKKAFPQTKVVVTGNLIRSNIYNQNSPKFNYLKSTVKKLPLIYVTGGNQGSEFINNLTYQLIPKISNQFTVIHQTGKNINLRKQQTIQRKYSQYYPYEYIDIEDIGWVLNNAEIIISRSGANICQEIDLLSKKTILIPLPYTQQDEQVKNAQWLQARHPNITKIFFQNETTVNNINQTIQELVSQPATTQSRSIPPANSLLKLIHELA